MHALHATLVERGIFDEIVWARLPPDHSHDDIDRFFSVCEKILGKQAVDECGSLWGLIKLLRVELATSKYKNDVVSSASCMSIEITWMLSMHSNPTNDK